MDDDTDDKDDSKRKSRNLSEKKRRDQFNLLVNELSSMVSSNNRKMDKSTVLKSTIVFLKNHNELAVRSRAHEIQEDWKPSYLSNEEFTHLILEALDGFIIVFSSTGRIFYASESVTSLLGHLPNDLLNMTIYDLAHVDDHSGLYNILLNPETVADLEQNDNQVIFSCHLKKGGLEHRDEPSFDLVHFVGYFRSDVHLDNLIAQNPTFNFPNEADTRLVFIGTARLQTPQLIREMTIVESAKNEFTSRHSLEWKFLYLDHRAPPIIGYLPFEVLGTSGYDYYHFDDLEKVISCHEALIQKGKSTSCYYRFLTKGHQWLWLQSRFYVTYHQWNSKPEFVVCTHRVVSYADVIQNSRNNSSEVFNKDSYNVTTDLNLKAASSMLLNSSRSSKNSRASRFATTPNSPGGRSRHRNDSCPGTDSDSTSISTESIASRHSMMTHYSSRPRIRQNAPTTKKISQHRAQSHQNEQISQIHTNPYRTVSQSQSHMTVPPMPPPQPMGTAFLEPSQYIATIPVQSAPTISIPTTTTVISPLQTPAILHPGVVMTSSRTEVHEHLERQHEELEQLIMQQKEELRRISEQLLMARYGIVPSIVNVAEPCTQNTNSSNTNKNAGNTFTQLHTNPQHQLHSHHKYHNPVCPSTGHPMQHQKLQEISVCQQNTSEVDTNKIGGEKMISYMQLTTVTASHLQQHLQQSQNQINEQQQQISGESEVMPFQMTQEQAQLLFASNLSPNASQQNH